MGFEGYDVDLTGSWLNGAVLSDACMPAACLDGAYLQGAVLDGAQLPFASLLGANLRGASLADAWLPGAQLPKVQLQGGNLCRVHFECADRLRLPGDSSINTGMECGGNVKARATTRFLWWTLHLTRDAAEAALLPSRSRKPGTGYGRRLAISRLAQGTEGKVCQSAARSYRSSTQPRQRAAEPRGSVSAFRPARRSAAGLCRTSTRSFRRGPSRGRRRKPEFVGDDGGGGA